MSTAETDLHARVAALEEAVRDGGFSFIRCGGRSHRFTGFALAEFNKLSGVDQIHVKAALSAIECHFVTSHLVRRLAAERVA